MPISLPPVSRRQFLSRAVGAAASLLLCPSWSRAAENPHSWVLFSDTHIAGDPKLSNRGVNMAQNLAQAVREVLALSQPPAAVLVNGDCAYGTGTPQDYKHLAQLLEPLLESGTPIHLGLGNHDHRENFLAGIKSANDGSRRPVKDKHVRLLRGERVNWFILDSLEQTNSTPGLLGFDQLEWLAGALDANRDQPAIVFVHHNPGINGNMGLRDTVRLFEIIRPRRQVKAYIFGHTHQWRVEHEDSGLHLVNLPPIAYVFRDTDPSGWILANVSKTSMRLEFQSLNRAHAAHGTVVELPWRSA